MDLATIRNAARVHLRDEAKEFIPDSDLTTWVNEAQRDLANRLSIIESEIDDGAVEADGSILLPARFINAQVLRIGTDNYEFVDDEAFFTARDAQQGAPYLVARIIGSRIELDPKPAAGTTYDLEYTSFPADLAADGDISPLPEELHIKLVWWAVWQGLLKEHEEGLAERFQALYYESIPPHPNAMWRKYPGPFRLRFEPTAWDEEGTHTGAGTWDGR